MEPTTYKTLRYACSFMFAAAVLLAPSLTEADEAAELAIRTKYDAKVTELNQKTKSVEAHFQQRADDLSQEAKAPFKLDMTVKWTKRDMSLHLPQTSMKTRRMSLHLPEAKWDMMSFGPFKTKGPVFKMVRRDFSLDLPEFKWARTGFVMTIPEFTVHEAHFLIPVNSSEIKEKGAKLESDARATFAALAKEYWDLNTAQQEELATAATGYRPTAHAKNDAASTRLIQIYDAAIAEIDKALRANSDAKGGLLAPGELSRLAADRAEIVAARTRALLDSKNTLP